MVRVKGWGQGVLPCLGPDRPSTCSATRELSPGVQAGTSCTLAACWGSSMASRWMA